MKIFLMCILQGTITLTSAQAGFYYVPLAATPEVHRVTSLHSMEAVAPANNIEECKGDYAPIKLQAGQSKALIASASSIPQASRMPLPHWQAVKGSTLRQVLEAWTHHEGIDLEWATEFDYPLATSFESSASFEEALQKLLDAFSESSPRPYGRLHKEGRHTLLLIQTRGKTHYDN